MEFLLLFLLLALLVRIPPNQDHFKSSGYKDASGHSFFETVFDPGRNGEYLTYSCLERFGEEHKLLTNIYLPKDDGTTTEIDLIMITATGIYVFESKNTAAGFLGTRTPNSGPNHSRAGKSIGFTTLFGKTKSTSEHYRST